MRFRLTAIFYTIALIASATAALGPCGAVLGIAAVVFWWYIFSKKSPEKAAQAVTGTLVTLACVSCCFCFLLPMVSTVREAARVNQCQNQLRMIALGIRQYEAKYGCLPPAYVADAKGRPMHSWRVLILPYIEEEAIYQQYDFSEPWDGPNNRLLANKGASYVYSCTSHSTNRETAYLAITGPQSMWPGANPRKMGEVTDGAAESLLLVEKPESGIHWMEPRDLTVEQFASSHANDQNLLGCRAHQGDHPLYYTCGWNAVFADETPHYFRGVYSAETLTALASVNAGDSPAPDWMNAPPPVYWRWHRIGQIIAGVVFVFLNLVPLTRVFRRSGHITWPPARTLATQRPNDHDQHTRE